MGGAHTIEDPPGRRCRGDRAEQPRLVPQLAQVADAVRAVRDRNGEIGEHRSGEVDRHRLVRADEGLVPGVDQTGVSGELSQQLRPGVGDHPLTISADSETTQPPATLHREGVLP